MKRFWLVKPKIYFCAELLYFMRFNYECPGCSSATEYHSEDCQYKDFSRGEIEARYIQILSQLAIGGEIAEEDMNGGNKITHGRKSGEDLQKGILFKLQRENHIIKTNSEKAKEIGYSSDSKKYVLLTEDQRKEILSTPDFEPMKTLYEYGTVPGCQDNGVFAMISFLNSAGLSWDETKEQVIEWLEETNSWERGSFEEQSIEQLVDKKRHVWANNYGFMDKAEAAVAIIKQSDIYP